MKFTLKLITLSVAALSSLALTGCETSDDRSLAAGQACLDAATAATANACLDKVAGLTSQESYMIRCSANFISQGFTGTRIADSISKIKSNEGGGTDPMVGMMAYLAFTNASPTANEAISNCTAAGSKSMLRLAAAAKLATTIANFAGGTPINPDSPTAAADLKAKIDALIASPNPTANAELGATAVVAANAYCGAGSSYEGTEVCTNLTAAVSSSSDPAAIGAALLSQLQANSGH